MIAEWLRMFRVVLKAFPAVMIVLFAVLPVWDWLFPWGAASQALAEYGPQLRLCVGAGSGTWAGDGSQGLVLERQRSYLLLPRVFIAPEVIVVRETSAHGAVAEASRGWFAIFASFVLVSLWLTWRWWVKPFRRGGREAHWLAI